MNEKQQETALIDKLWQALRSECCKSPDAKTIVFLGEDKFRQAIAPLLQQPTGERCGECPVCGHRDGIGDAGGLCTVQVAVCSDDYHGTRACGCKCVFPATEAPTSIELDPLEFWCDLAEVLGRPRPDKVSPVDLIAEVGRRLTTTGAGAETERQRQFEVWWKGQIASDFAQQALGELEKINGPKLVAGVGPFGAEATAISAARRKIDQALAVFREANEITRAAPATVAEAVGPSIPDIASLLHRLEKIVRELSYPSNRIGDATRCKLLADDASLLLAKLRDLLAGAEAAPEKTPAIVAEGQIRAMSDAEMDEINAAIRAQQAVRTAPSTPTAGVGARLARAIYDALAENDDVNHWHKDAILPMVEKIVDHFPLTEAAQVAVEAVSGFNATQRLSHQEDTSMTKDYDGFRAGMLRAAELARQEFKRAPEAAKGNDCVWMGGYESACDHLSVVIAQAAVIDSVRAAGSQPDWQYHIALLLPGDGVEDQALLKIFQVVEHELAKAGAADAGEVERLRGILRSQRETIKHWQHHVLITSRLLGCAAIDEDVEAAIDKLKHDSATARADAIRECVKELRRRADHAESTGNHLPGTDRAKELHIEARVLARTATALLQSLTKGKEDDGPTEAQS